MIEVGSTIGILGGGQLGRMSAMAARHMGYRVHVFDPSPNPCAAPVADVCIQADYDDKAALEAFASDIDVITLEFENIPLAALETLEWRLPVRPGSRVLSICQHRLREKNFLTEDSFPCAPYQAVNSLADLEKAIDEIGLPSVLKTSSFGYDGKGQVKINKKEDASDAWEAIAGQEAVLEKWIQHRGEFSVICARNRKGDEAVYPVVENVHTKHILDLSIVPARIPEALQTEAQAIARNIAKRIGLVGVIAVELFLTHEDRWIVNELAPRPHNSGHYSLNASQCSQFEQHIRAVCDLPLASTETLKPAIMINILGDSWIQGTPPWDELLLDGDSHLHLYDKGEPKPGRKMGHLTLLGNDADTLMQKALHLRSKLQAIT